MDKWREIWNKSDRIDDYILETLIKADGFDIGDGSFTLKNWKTYVQGSKKPHFQLNRTSLFMTLAVGVELYSNLYIYLIPKLEGLTTLLHLLILQIG